MEIPNEDSLNYESHCGQGNTIPFYMDYRPGKIDPKQNDRIPTGNNYGIPYTMQKMDLDEEWDYRRVYVNHNESLKVQNYNLSLSSDIKNQSLKLDIKKGSRMKRR